MASQGGVMAVERALRILRAFDDERPILTLAQLSEATGLYKSTILRICASLLEYGHLVRLRDGSYCLGPEALRMGRVYKHSFRMGELVRMTLENLVAACDETASYHIRDGDMRICVDCVTSPQPVSHNLREGERQPLSRGAGGHVFLAFNGAEGPHYDQIRRDLFAVSHGETDPDTAAVAAPVFSENGIAGVLAFSGPLSRFTPETIQDMAEELRRAAAALSRALGGALPDIRRK